MANFCSNCGAKMSGRFCSECGSSLQTTGHWQAKEIDTGEGAHNVKGTLSLSNDYLVFFSYAFISGKAKERRRIPLSGIKSIIRTPILNTFTIRYNRASKGSNWLRRFIGMRSVCFKIKNWEPLIENIRRLNPNIKIKT